MLEIIGFGFDLTVVIRVIASVLLGFAIGFEREITNKDAGLRTNILVCVGACIFTIISIYGFPEVTVLGDELGTRDTARVAAQIVTGIGFIGGGTVLRHGFNIYGLTTAATLWVSTAIGMACGAGMFGLAVISTILSIFVLVLVRLFEKNVLVTSTKNTKQLKVNITCLNEQSNYIYDYIIENYSQIREISKKFNKDESLTKINVILNISNKNPIKSMYKSFEKIEGIESISIQEFVE